MAGLFGDSWEDPRSMAALQLAGGLLSAGGPSRNPTNLGAGLLGGLQQYQGVMDNARRQKMLEQQMQIQQDDFGLRKQEFGLREQERQTVIAEKQRQAQIAQQRDQYLAGLAAGNPLNPAEAFRFGITPEHAKSLVESGNWGRPVVKTWKQVRGPNGVIEIGLDEYGQPVRGAQQTPFIPPKMQDLGGKVVAVDETALKPGQEFGKTMTPGEQASDSVARANLGIAGQRLALDQAQAFKPEFHDGQWVTRPNAGAPAGGATPVPGYMKPLGEGPKKQVAGIESLRSAADEYISALDNWSTGKMVSPNARAQMGTYYNNMMLQAKEAYNLGVLNGPDYQILTSIVKDPTTFGAAFVSNDTLKSQARELKRLMTKTEQAVRSTGGQQPQVVPTMRFNPATGKLEGVQ